MKLPSFGFLLNAFGQVCRRFPGAMLCAVAGVVAVFALIDNGSDHFFTRNWMLCQLGLPLLTGLVVWAESKSWNERRNWLLQGLGLAALVVYWYFLDPDAPSFEYRGLPRYLTWILVAHLFVAVAPYLNARSVAHFWDYNRQLFANIVIGVVFTLILYAGLALAILAVDQLFDLNIDSKHYVRLFVVLAGIFNTTYFLFHFPKQYEFAEADAGYNAVFKNLCKYILIPIVGLYFFILYAYSGKIIATWSLPRGWVSSLVLGFSVAGIFTYLLNFYLPEHDDSSWVRGYKKWFWWVLLPLTVLLFVAIGKRIGDYGVTEPRFLVAHLGVWLAATCLYFLLSKHDNIKFIPISLILFAIVYAFGPFNAFKVAERSQVGMLKTALEKNGRWENGRMKQGTSEVPKEDVAQISSALQFLERRNALQRMDWLPMPVDSFPESSGIYDVTGRIMAWAGVDARSEGVDADYLNITPLELYPRGADVRGFTRFYHVTLNQYRDEKPEQGYFFSLSEDNKHLNWQQAKAGEVRVVEVFDLQPVLKKWTASSTEYALALPPNEAFFDLIGKKGTIRFLVTEARVEKESGLLQLEYLNGYLFLKEK